MLHWEMPGLALASPPNLCFPGARDTDSGYPGVYPHPHPPKTTQAPHLGARSYGSTVYAEVQTVPVFIDAKW